jgi:protein ImuB
VWLDVTGCGHLFGGEEELLADLVQRLERAGYAARAALAETPGAAWALARFAGAEQPLIVQPGGGAAALAALPVAALRLPGVIVDGLSRMGLRCIGEVDHVPRAPLVARFGELIQRRLDQALGRLDEPISPKQPVPAFRARLGLPEPIGLREDIERGTGRLLSQLGQQLDRAQQGGRAFELACYRADNAVRRIQIRTGRPARDPERLLRLFAQHFDRLDPGPGIEVMVLTAPVSERLAPAQIALPALDKKAAAGLEQRRTKPRRDDIAAPAGAAVDDLVDRLAGRLGLDAVLTVAPRESHLPERESRLRLYEPAPPAALWRRNRPRPVRLLTRPEPVEAVALVPDHPPVLFRWRGVTHRIQRADGPERIAGEWWLEERPTRDYFRVEDDAGRRFWLYRDGLFGERTTPRWYVHGLFA